MTRLEELARQCAVGLVHTEEVVAFGRKVVEECARIASDEADGEQRHHMKDDKGNVVSVEMLRQINGIICEIGETVAKAIRALAEEK